MGLPARATRFCQRQARGSGIHEVLEAIVHLVPPPKGSPDAPLRALIFDSWFDPYRGVIILVRVVDGRVTRDRRSAWSQRHEVYEVEGSATQSPKPIALRRTRGRRSGLSVREHQDGVGRPDRRHDHGAATVPLPALPGFEEIKPMVFAGLFPVESHEHGPLRDALEKLRLNDSALHF